MVRKKVVTLSIRVAVASSDGKFINSHFGRTKSFLIFDVENKKYKFIEKRENNPACYFGEHTYEGMEKSIELISDCNAIIASRIGIGAATLLIKNGIHPYEVVGFINDVLDQFASSICFQN